MKTWDRSQKSLFEVWRLVRWYSYGRRSDRNNFFVKGLFPPHYFGNPSPPFWESRRERERESRIELNQVHTIAVTDQQHSNIQLILCSAKKRWLARTKTTNVILLLLAVCWIWNFEFVLQCLKRWKILVINILRNAESNNTEFDSSFKFFTLLLIRSR